jgi:hypothetical protein
VLLEQQDIELSVNSPMPMEQFTGSDAMLNRQPEFVFFCSCGNSTKAASVILFFNCLRFGLNRNAPTLTYIPHKPKGLRRDPHAAAGAE